MILHLLRGPGLPGFVEVETDGLLYLVKDGKMTAFHTLRDTFYHYGPLEVWEGSIREHEPTFIRSDRSFVVNAKNVKYMANVLGKDHIYFQKREEVDLYKSKRCTVADINIDLFERIIQKYAGPPI